nr:26s proteasome non-atpase regulatory subunit 10 [Quercus suber]
MKAEPNAADLQSDPAVYYSPRAQFDVLIGEDSALPFVKACSSDDEAALRSMLSQPHWIEIALETPHVIYSRSCASPNGQDTDVFAKPMSNLARGIIIASMNGYATCVATLLDFTVAARVVNYDVSYAGMPLDLAVRLGHTQVVAVLLEFGANPARSGPSLLYFGANFKDPRMIEVLMKHGVPIAHSGALQQAARSGALDNMRILIQYGADVNEQLTEGIIPGLNQSLYASWTSMHFAAQGKQVEAMKLLERGGARSDVRDEHGKTPAQLLEEHE